jgi:LacI family transcriptional regulator
MLKSSTHSTALFSANNFMTIGAINAIQEAGLSIPTDIGFVGFDDVNWTELNNSRLTIIAQLVNDIGKMAAQRLLAYIKGDNSSPQKIRLKTRFIVRQSVGTGYPKREPTPAA